MLTGQSWLRLAEFVGEFAELSVVDVDATVDHLLHRACEIVGGDDALLGFAVHDPNAPAGDPLKGWHPPAPDRPRRYGPHATRAATVFNAWCAARGNQPLDKLTLAMAAGTGDIRAVMHRDVMTARQWQRSEVFELLDASRIADCLAGGRPVGEDVELLLVMYRRCGRPPFDDDDRLRMQMIMAALAGVGPRVARAHGLIDASRPLTGRERQTLRHLLAGLSEKQVAAAIGLSERTLHHHVTALYQKFRVQSRAELMSLFLVGSASPNGRARLVVPSLISDRQHAWRLPRGSDDQETSLRSQESSRE